MTRPVTLFSLSLLLLTPGTSPSQSRKAVTAFVNVNVIPMDRERVLEDQTVFIQDRRIIALGPHSSIEIPNGTTRIDGRGKYLIPGLGEMHAHIPVGAVSDSDVERVLFLYVANGVTVVRGMLGHPSHLELKQRVLSDDVLAPTIYTSGPSLNGRSVPTPAAAARAVSEQHAAGYDFLKIHPGVKRAVFDSLAATAKRLGMRFAGHVPADVGLARALEAGYWSIDHLDGYAEALAPDGTPGGAGFFGLGLARSLDEASIDSLARETRAAGVWNVPTEVLIDNIVAGEDTDVMSGWPEMRYVSPRTVDGWIDRTTRQRDAVALEARWHFVSIRHQLIKALYNTGAGVVLGSDAPQVWNVPGFSAHRELALMVDAGLTPYQALEIGTTNVARFLGAQDESGTIAVGKRADLVLLDANPLADITATSRRAGVMLRGRWLSRAEIEERLEKYANP